MPRGQRSQLLVVVCSKLKEKSWQQSRRICARSLFVQVLLAREANMRAAGQIHRDTHAAFYRSVVRAEPLEPQSLCDTGS